MLELLNYREGFAMNSSSSHHLAFHREMKDNFDINGNQFGWEWFVLASEDARRRYILAVLYGNMREHPRKMCDLYADHLLGGDASQTFKKGIWGIDHQSSIWLPKKFDEDIIDEEFAGEFIRYMLQEGLVILGGNDNNDDGHQEVEGLFRLPMGEDSDNAWRCRKDTRYNYWTLFNRKNGNRIRMRFNLGSSEFGEFPPYAELPELIDVKITDYCDKVCEFCYQDSTMKGQHAGNMWQIAQALKRLKVFEVAIGGGEPTAHPEFSSIIENFCKCNIVPNFTTRDFKWRTQESSDKIMELIGGVAYSVRYLWEIRATEGMHSHKELLGYDEKKKVSFKIVLGAIDRRDYLQILRYCSLSSYDLTILGFKAVGRGAKYKVVPYSWWLEDLLMVHKECNGRVYIDTILAAEFEEQLKAAEIPRYLYTVKEGAFSAYLDAVTMKFAPSSYHQGESLDLSHFGGDKWNIEKPLAEAMRNTFQKWNEEVGNANRSAD